MYLVIRKLSLKDASILLELFRNEDSLKDTGVNISRSKITLNFTNEWLKERIEQYNSEKPSFLVYAIANKLKIFVGTIGIGNINYKNKTAEIGYWISKENSGKGYCTNAIKLFMKKIPKQFGLKKLIAEVSRENIASYKALEKNGFKLTQRIKNTFILEKEL